MIIIGMNNNEQKNVKLFGANGQEIELVGVAEPLVVTNEEEKEMTEEEATLAEIKKLEAQLAALQAEEVAPVVEQNTKKVSEVSNVKKNQKPGKANESRK